MSLPIISSKMIFTFLLLMNLSLDVHSESGNYLPSHHNKECDTINIDKCFITRNGAQYVIDTNVEDEINGHFSILRAKPLYPNYCMLYVERTCPVYTVYDSVKTRKKTIYLVDTSYSTEIYNVLVENKEELKGPLQHLVDYYLSNEGKKKKKNRTIPLRLCRFYNIGQLSRANTKRNSDEYIGKTVSCEQCHVIILHGKVEIIYDCPLYDNLYRLK